MTLAGAVRRDRIYSREPAMRQSGSASRPREARSLVLDLVVTCALACAVAFAGICGKGSAAALTADGGRCPGMVCRAPAPLELMLAWLPKCSPPREEEGHALLACV